MEFFKLTSFLFSILWLVSCCVASDPGSEVAIRYNVLADCDAAGKRKMPLGTSSYFEMISGGVFVDKSLFIASVLWSQGAERSIVITCPKRWGKSMNLMMLKEYLQFGVHENGTLMRVKDTANHKVFRMGILESYEVRVPAFEEDSKLGIAGCANETGFQNIANDVDHVTREISIKLNDTLLISSEKYKKLSDEYLGRYAVIYISMVNFSMATEPESFLSKFKDVISETFNQHKYMSAILKRKSESSSYSESFRKYYKHQHDKFESYLQKINDKVEWSVYFLSEILYDHFHQRVFILIDEYDSVFNNRGLDTETYLGFLSKCTKGNKYLEKSVFTGILPVVMGFGAMLNDLTIYAFVDSPFHKYYGYTRLEMQQLYEYYNVEREEQDIFERYYDGYHTSDEQISRVVNPWSTNNYMNTRKADTYWLLGTSYLDEMENMFNAGAFVILEFLMQSGKTWTSRWFHISMMRNDFEVLTKLGNSSNETPEGCDVVLKYFSFTGYLTGSFELGSPSYRVTLSIPNEEVRVVLQTIQDYQFMRRYRDEWKLIEDARRAWNDYFETNGTSPSTLESTLKRFLESYPFLSMKYGRPDLQREYGYETLMESIFSLTLRGLGKYDNLFSIQYQNPIDGSQTPDILLCSSTTCVVIEVKYNQNVRSALDGAKKCGDMFKAHRKFADITRILYIGCNVDKSMNVRIASKLVSFKWDKYSVKRKDKSKTVPKQTLSTAKAKKKRRE